jgi:hypothetical protein
MQIQLQNLLLYRRITINSQYPLHKARSIISKAIIHKRLPANQELLFPHGPMDYEGKVTDSGFRINRIVRSRNSFLPFLYGKFITTPKGTQIDTLIIINPIAAFILIGFVFLSTVFSLSDLIATKDFIGSISLTWLFVLLMYPLALGTFIDECKIAIRFLNQVFENGNDTFPEEQKP